MGEIQDRKISEFCGAMIGDGWIQSNESGLFLAGDSLEDKEYYDNHISKLVSQILAPTKAKNFPYWSVYGISIYKKELIRKALSDFELPKGKKVKTAKVPQWIVKSNKRIIQSFVRGLFDTDGGIFCQKDYTEYAKEFNSRYHTKIRLRFTTVSKRLNEELFSLVRGLGFKAVKRTIKKGFKDNRNNSDVQILELNGIESIKRFFEEIKPSNPKHTTKYLIWKKFGFCPPRTTILQRKQMLKSELSPYLFYKQE